MKTAVAFTIGVTSALLVADVTRADPYNIAIQQAKRASDQNTAEQNRLQQAEGGSSSANSGPGQPPPNPALQATLKNISSLQTDVGALGAATDAESAADQKTVLLNDLSTAAQGTKPSSSAVRTLAKDLITALAGKKVPAEQQTKLARSLHALFNSAHLNDTQRQTIFDNVQKILNNAGVSVDAATDVVTDLKQVADETK